MERELKRFVDCYPQMPKYVKLAEQFRRQIENGELQPGDRLPSFVELRGQLGVGQSTLERAYMLLEQEALIAREPGRGIFVAEPSRRPQTGLIGLYGVTPLKAEHPYYAQLLAGVQQGAHDANREVLLLNDAQPLRPERVDGIVIYASRPHLALERLPADLPRVAVLYPTRQAPSVVSSDYDGARQATEHLIKLGHRRIAYLLSPRNSDLMQARLRGYRDALREAGIEPNARWVRDLQEDPQIEPGEIFRSFIVWGRNTMQEWLDGDWKELGCTAVLAHNDDAAIGVMQALSEAGAKTPDDVSVVGFDDTRDGQFFTPALTSVHVPLREIGEQAVRLLREQMDAPVRLPGTVAAAGHDFEPCVLSTTLAVRSSTAPARECASRADAPQEN